MAAINQLQQGKYFGKHVSFLQKLTNATISVAELHYFIIIGSISLETTEYVMVILTSNQYYIYFSLSILLLLNKNKTI
jgi:hypothetical protein